MATNAIVPHDGNISMPSVLSLEKINAIKEIARVASQSNMTKSSSPYDAFFIAVYGLELGIPVMTALRTIYSVKGGAPTCSGEAMLSLLRRSGKVRISLPDPGKVTDEAVVTIERLDTGEKQSFTFTMDMARRANLIKSGGNWEMYPQMMLIWRAVSMGAKLLCSDIIGGLYTVEEIYPDTQVDENGAPTGEIVPEDSKPKAANVVDFEEAEFEEIAAEDTSPTKEGDTTEDEQPTGWGGGDPDAMLATLKDKLDSQTGEDLTNAQLAKLAGCAWKFTSLTKKYATGKDAYTAMLAAYKASQQPAQPSKSKGKATDWVAYLHDLYGLTEHAALELLNIKAWAQLDGISEDGIKKQLFEAVLEADHTFNVRSVRYVKPGKAAPYLVVTNTPYEVQIIGLKKNGTGRDTIRDLGDETLTEIVEAMHPDDEIDLRERGFDQTLAASAVKVEDEDGTFTWKVDDLAVLPI